MTTTAKTGGEKTIRNVSRRSRIHFSVVFLAYCCLTVSIVQAAIVDSLKANPRVFNDFTTSTLTITNNYPSRAVIDDRNLVDDGMGGNFANRHDLTFSPDGGASSTVFNINDVFTLQVLLKLDVGVNGPRKEAGIRFDPSVGEDALFIVNSDAGEIVAFGGPFFSFGGNGTNNGYTPGSTILMGVTYHGDTTPRTSTYFIDRDPLTPGGIETSGPLPWTNVEGGATDFTVALYTQVAPASGSDFVTATFTNISIPEPSSGILLGCAMALFAMPARDRRRGV